MRRLKALFAERYGATPTIYRAPGRVNLIGEHTDYNDGFVMPAALNLYTYVAVSPRADRQLRVYSENLGEMCDLDLDSIRPGRSGHWSDYVRGVAGVLESSGYRLRGADLAIISEVPLGAGPEFLGCSRSFNCMGAAEQLRDRCRSHYSRENVPEGRASLRRNEMRNHGPVHLMPRPRWTRPDVGLPFSRFPTSSHAAPGTADGVQYHGQA